MALFTTASPARRTRKARFLLVFLALLVVAAGVLFPRWKAVSDQGGQRPHPPFRIAGNLYYVGTRDVTAYLLTGPQGHVLIDGGYPGTAPMILKSIATLGFNIRDVKILLNSHAHFDHAGGLAALQQAAGAQLWVSEADAPIVASGGVNKHQLAPLNWLVYCGLLKFPAPRVDRRFRDGTTIRLGSTVLTARVTGAHTPGCTSWVIPLREGNRSLLAVSVGSLSLPVPRSLFQWKYDATTQAEIKRCFAVLRSLPADIYLASHARTFELKRKFTERATAADPVAPFLDRRGYWADITKAEQAFRRVLQQQQQRTWLFW